MKFTKSGFHLLAGNDEGMIVLFDIARGAAIETVQTCQTRAIWSIDVSWDDSLVAIGTEVGSIELYSLKKMLRAETRQKAQEPKRE